MIGEELSELLLDDLLDCLELCSLCSRSHQSIVWILDILGFHPKMNQTS